MVKLDYYVSVGFALELLSKSEYHSQRELGSYFRNEVLPPIWMGQIRFSVTADFCPMGMVTWAWISPEVEREIHQTGRSLKRDEWDSGDRMFINDWIAPYKNVRQVLQDMKDNLFPDQDVATSVRRNPDGSVRRVNKWYRAKPKRTSWRQRHDHQ